MEKFFQVPNEIFDSDLSISQKIVLIYLYRAGNNGAPIYPSYGTIAKKCGMSRHKAIKTIKELESLGIVAVKRRIKGKRINNSNQYYINREAIPVTSANDVSLNGELDVDFGKQDIPPGLRGGPRIVHGVDPINKPVINKPNMNNHSVGSNATSAPCDCPHGAISFNEYVDLFRDNMDPDILDAMDYFIEYKKSVHGEHKNMTVESWNRAANEILEVSTLVNGEPGVPFDCDWDEYTALVERYFEKVGQFAQGCDYSIPHFNSPHLKAILYHEAGLH